MSGNMPTQVYPTSPRPTINLNIFITAISRENGDQKGSKKETGLRPENRTRPSFDEGIRPSCITNSGEKDRNSNEYEYQQF